MTIRHTAEIYTQDDGGSPMAFRRLTDGRVEIEVDISGIGKVSWYMRGKDWTKATRAVRVPARKR